MLKGTNYPSFECFEDFIKIIIMSYKNVKLFSKHFQNEDSKFILATALKVAGVFIVLSFFMAYLIWIILSVNNVFFESQGKFVFHEFRQAYFDYILSTSLNYLPYYLFLVVVIFFIGVYLGILLLRPFSIIGDYCRRKVEGENIVYNPDLFSDYKLLTRFSELFFTYINECERQKALTPNVIPPQYQKIKKPIFERVFFFHFMLFIIFIMLVSSMAVTITTYEIQANIFNLAVDSLKTGNKSVIYFFRNQEYIFESFIWVLNCLIVIIYTALGFHLYKKVSGAIFAFFTTMKQFMKGNYKARVHLLEYKHIRPYSISFNKYLDHVERVLEKKNK